VIHPFCIVEQYREHSDVPSKNCLPLPVLRVSFGQKLPVLRAVSAGGELAQAVEEKCHHDFDGVDFTKRWGRQFWRFKLKPGKTERIKWPHTRFD
jgi:hypothetical protein